MKKALTIAMSTVIVLGCSSGNTENERLADNEFTEVAVTAVTQQIIEQNLIYSGLIEPTVDVPLSFGRPGTIAMVYVKVGESVEVGDLLAELDNASYQSAYESALATQKQAQDAYNRLSQVHEQGTLPDIDWEEVKAKLAQANSAAAIAKQNLDQCQIRAPFSGVIAERRIESGSNVVAGLMAFRLINFEQVYARISVPEDEINLIEKAQLATVKVPAISETLEGKVDQVGIVANAISKTFEVKIMIDNQELAMRPGMVSNVEIPLETSETAILVPINTVSKGSGNSNYVYVVTDDLAEKRRVQVQSITNNMILISSGLELGEMVVVEGQHKLSNNTKVMVRRKLVSLY